MFYILYLAASILFAFGVYMESDFLLSIGFICMFNLVTGMYVIDEIRGNK